MFPAWLCTVAPSFWTTRITFPSLQLRQVTQCFMRQRLRRDANAITRLSMSKLFFHSGDIRSHALCLVPFASIAGSAYQAPSSGRFRRNKAFLASADKRVQTPLMPRPRSLLVEDLTPSGRNYINADRLQALRASRQMTRSRVAIGGEASHLSVGRPYGRSLLPAFGVTKRARARCQDEATKCGAVPSPVKIRTRATFRQERQIPVVL